MADGQVSIKFSGNANDVERAVASLEKKYEQLTNQISETTSKSKQAAIAQKEAIKAHEKAVQEDAKLSREVFRQTVTALKQAEKEKLAAEKVKSAEARELIRQDAAEARRTYRQTLAVLKQAEQDELSAKKAVTAEKQRLVRQDADEARRVYKTTIAALKEAEQAELKAKRESSNETRRLAREDANESRRVFRQTVNALKEQEREEVRATREASNEKKRIRREEAREINRIARQLTRDKKQAEQHEKMLNDNTKHWVTLIGSAALAYAGVSNVVDTLITKQQELIDKADEFGLKQDRHSRQFAVQAGLTALESKDYQKSINEEALRAGVDTEQATAAATQLVSSGFTAKESSSTALRKILQGMAASGEAGGDAGQFALNASQALAASGMEKNQANLDKVMRAMFASKRAGNFLAPDLEQLAPKLQGFVSQGGSFEEAMAAFNTMKETTNKEQAATSFKIMVERLMGAKGDKKRTAQLEKLGLKPEDVDLIGESLGDVGKLLNERMSKLDATERQPFLQKFFGTEAASSVQGFLNKQQRFQEFIDVQKNTDDYMKAVGVAQSGPDVAARRSKVKNELQISDKHNDLTLLFDEFERQQRNSGASEAQIAITRQMANLQRMFGIDPRTALDTGSFMTGSGGSGRLYDRSLLNVSKMKGGEDVSGVSAYDTKTLNEMVEVEREIEKARLKNEGRIDRNPQEKNVDNKHFDKLIETENEVKKKRVKSEGHLDREAPLGSPTEKPRHDSSESSNEFASQSLQSQRSNEQVVSTLHEQTQVMKRQAEVQEKTYQLLASQQPTKTEPRRAKQVNASE